VPKSQSLGGMFDLREHFGLWDHCGNTRFFKKRNSHSEIYLNPIDGILVSAHRNPVKSEEPRYTFVVKDARRAEDKDVEEAFARNYPWVQKAVEQFFYSKAMGWVIKALRERRGERLPGDPDLFLFLSFYKPGGERYEKEGGSAETEMMLEEVLQAILTTMGSMDRITVDYGRDLSQEDLDEALGHFGILECK
jgi:hypothetical protein